MSYINMFCKVVSTGYNHFDKQWHFGSGPVYILAVTSALKVVPSKSFVTGLSVGHYVVQTIDKLLQIPELA